LNTNPDVSAVVLKFSVTNPKHIPTDAIKTESQQLAEYIGRQAEGTGEPIADVMARNCPGIELPQHHQCRLGSQVLDALNDRYLRTEVREVKKYGRVTKYAIMFFFANRTKDKGQAVEMGQPSRESLKAFAQKTFAGARLWNNPGRFVIDFVSLKPEEPALEEISLHFTPIEGMMEIGWVTVPAMATA
jgi:hypothetical protein